MHVKNAFKGAAIGAANIIPGVSGGTMALMLGVYEPIIELLSSINPQELLRALKSKEAFIHYWKEKNLSFALAIGLGAIIAVGLLSKILKFCLLEAHDPTYGFFFGLILTSIVIPYRMIKKKSSTALLAILLGVGSVVALSHSIPPGEKIENAEKKLELKQKKALGQASNGDKWSFDVEEIFSFFTSGVIGISAMILPGLSGSFVLLLLGMYFEVIDAIAKLNLIPLGFFALGCGLGLLLFSRILRVLLHRFHDTTMAFLTGLVIGSLYAVWPFKDHTMIGPTRVDMSNIIPQAISANLLFTILSILMGIIVVAAFLRYESKKTS